MKAILIIIFLFAINISNLVYSQNSCTVLIEEISDSYSGKCKNGLAHGKGIASGTDVYDGSFKKGVPNGYGIYRWKAGDIYKGYWKKGSKHGFGKLILPNDSIISGIWKENKFIKEATPPEYMVIKRHNANSYSVRKISEGNDIKVTVTKNGSPFNGFGYFEILNSSGRVYYNNTKTGVDNASYPLNCIIKYDLPNDMMTNSTRVEFEIDILEPGRWEITIRH